MNSSALPDIISIKNNSEIKDLFANARKVSTRYGSFFLSNDSKVNQISFAVLIKKNIGNAVKRNYCKRIVRAYFRSNIKLFANYGKVLFLYTYKGKVKFRDLVKEFDLQLHAL
jgi:ribonuclease P protein component